MRRWRGGSAPARCVRNGDLVKLAPGDPEIIDEVPAGRIYKDGSLLIQAESRTVADRKRLSFSGIISVALAVNDKGALLADPEIELIGIPDNTADGGVMENIAYNAVVETLDSLPKPRRRDPDSVAEAIRRGVRLRWPSTGAKSRTSPCISWSCERAAMADLKMTLACWNYDRTRALMDGSVKPEGIDLTYHNSFPAATFHRMMGQHEFEASELGLTFYLDTLHEDDPPFVAIPVYPIRLFSHSAIYINTNKGIREPKDLIGRKIGEFFLYGHDAGTWSKGILQDHYGVPIDGYSNYIGGVERPTPPLPWYKQKPPPHIRVQHIGTETTLDAMLDAGEIDALFSALVPPSMARGSKNIARLFPDFEKVERNYYRTTGIFPIQHVVAIRKDVYKANPWVAKSLYTAFRSPATRPMSSIGTSPRTCTACSWCRGSRSTSSRCRHCSATTGFPMA